MVISKVLGLRRGEGGVGEKERWRDERGGNDALRKVGRDGGRREGGREFIQWWASMSYDK